MKEVWLLEACYDDEASYIIGVFDHKPVKKEQDEVAALSSFPGADQYLVSKWPVKGRTK